MATENQGIFKQSIFKQSVIKLDNFPPVDWLLLAEASQYYKNLGYIYQETPWVIPEEYSRVTKPHNNLSFQINKDLFESQPHELVGSAEQGFLYLFINNLLKPGKYFSVSPCFRVDSYDATHLPWFMKLELFAFASHNNDLDIKYGNGNGSGNGNADNPNEDNEINSAQNYHDNQSLYQTLLHDAESFFAQYAPTQIKQLEDGTSDINVNGIEVGSYGVRSIADMDELENAQKNNSKSAIFSYAYGTGLALPRFSIAR